MKRQHLFLLLLPLALGALGACRPLAGDASALERGGGPVLRIDSPRADDILPLRWRVSLTAEDVDRVASVAILCGREDESDRRPLHAWTTAPYEADVDLSLCLGSSEVTQARVHLLATAADGEGNSSTAEVSFTLDRNLPQLTALLPARVRPNAPVEVRLFSESALAAPPLVQVDGAAVPVTPGAGGEWVATFLPPPIGAAAWSGSGAPPLSVLEAVERPVQVTITARTDVGNELTFTREVVTSVVAWERDLPAQLIVPDADDRQPVGTATGLSVALAMEDEDPTGPWIPARIDAATGELSLPPLSPTDTGRGFAHDGRPILNRAEGSGPPHHELVDWTGVTLQKGDLGTGPLARLPERTCVQDVAAGSCTSPGFQYRCLGGADSQELGQLVTNAYTAQLATVSGGAVVSLDFAACTAGRVNDLALYWDGQSISAPALADVNPNVPELSRVLPVGNTGRFAVAHLDSEGQRVTRFLDGSGFRPGVMHTGDRTLLFARPSGSVVTATSANGQTRLEVFDASSEDPVGSAVLPGTFLQKASEGLETTQVNAAVFGDDRVLFAGWTHHFGRAVVALGPDLAPAYVYRYPRGTSSLTVAYGEGGYVYLVDATNHRVTALYADW